MLFTLCKHSTHTYRAGYATKLPRQRDHVRYCIMSIFVVATPLIQRDLIIFHIFSCPWSSISLSRCRCREVQHLSGAQLCIHISPELVPEPLGRLPVEAVGHGGQDTQTQLALHISTTDRLCYINNNIDNQTRILSTIGRLCYIRGLDNQTRILSIICRLC